MGDTSSRSLALRALAHLERWLPAAEKEWVTAPDGSGWYGTGYNDWGVQTNQKYIAASAVVGTASRDEALAAHARERAVAALRFSLDSHVSGPGACADGTSWGCTWISPLGIERMMFAVDLLSGVLSDQLIAGVDRMLVAEAEWIRTSFCRGDVVGIVGDVWADGGLNAPESNIWAGALLWRTSMRNPQHRQAEAWRELAKSFFINGVSVPSDASDTTIVDGRTVAERFAGANFFETYALDHHGYLNTGYQVICVSNVAMLHFDALRCGWAEPESLHRHQESLWRVIRPQIATDGRLLRIGGDSRVRYAYCQEYLLPALLYAYGHLGDVEALALVEAQLALIDRESADNEDGSFFARRLAVMAEENPYYYTRIESDRACALAMVHTYAGQLDEAECARRPDRAHSASDEWSWIDLDHKAVARRDRGRFASVSWRAFTHTQALNVPLSDSSLAEWDLNMSPAVHALGDHADGSDGGWRGRLSRRVITSAVDAIPGGFVTSGIVAEGYRLSLAEGWNGGTAATSMLAYAALPDGVTMLGIQRVVSADRWASFVSVKGLHLGVPNDVYNGHQRRLHGDAQSARLISGQSETRPLGRWLNIDSALGVVALRGADVLVLDRSAAPRGGAHRSLIVDEICFPHVGRRMNVPPGTVLIDHAFAVLAGRDEVATQEIERRSRDLPANDARGDHADFATAAIRACDGRHYVLVLNTSATASHIPHALAPDGVEYLSGTRLLEPGCSALLVVPD